MVLYFHMLLGRCQDRLRAKGDQESILILLKLVESLPYTSVGPGSHLEH